MAEIRGQCLCGAVRYSAPEKPLWTALCHCESCRRSASAPVVAWMGFSEGEVTWTGERKFFRSSEIAIRGFCPDCGTQLSFQSTRWPGEIHLYAASREDPENYVPNLHCHTQEEMDWLKIHDDLPRYRGSASLDKDEGA